MKVKTYVIAGAVVLAVAGTGIHVLEAVPSKDNPTCMKRELVTKGIQIGLSAEQMGQIKEVLQSHKQDGIPLLREFAEAKSEMRSAVMSTPVDEDRIRESVQKVSSIGEEVAIKSSKIHEEIDAILTERQRRIFADIVSTAESYRDGMLDRIEHSELHWQ